MKVQSSSIGESLNIKILSYNTLIEKSSFTRTVKSQPSWQSYSWASRKQQILVKILSQSPEIICLQEIRHINRFTTPNYYQFQQPLKQMGFEGVFAKRNIAGQFGEEGIAIFFNHHLLTLVQSNVLYFNDGTGRMALQLLLRSFQGCLFKVINTHIIYPANLQKTKKEVEKLADWATRSKNEFPCFVTGDFNLCSKVSRHRQILESIYKNFVDSHQLLKIRTPTFSLNLEGSNCVGMIPQLFGMKIDYIFTSRNIQALTAQVVGKPQNLPKIQQPSDHLPVIGTYLIPLNSGPILTDFQKLISLLKQTRERNLNDPSFAQFLDIFWLLPRSIKHEAYRLTYEKAKQLGIYQQNHEFGRIAFLNNNNHDQAILNEEGEKIDIVWKPLRNELVPANTIIEVLMLIQERITMVQELLYSLKNEEFSIFINKFDRFFRQQNRNHLYGEIYKISCEKKIYNEHIQFGKVSFRRIDGWDVPDGVREKALENFRLP